MGFFDRAFLVFLMKESKKRRQKQPGKLMAKSCSQPVNLPSFRPLINPLTCRDLDYYGYHKTKFNYCFIIYCFMENIQKLLCEMQVDFTCASKNTRTNAPSIRITRNQSSARTL